MRKEISATELHRKFGEFLEGVYHNGDWLIVKRANTPLAAIVPIEVYEGMLQQREQAFSVLYWIGSGKKCQRSVKKKHTPILNRQLLKSAPRKYVKKRVSCLPDACCTGYKPAY